MPKYRYKPYKVQEMTINFGQFYNHRETTLHNPFQIVKSEMLKRKEKLTIRKKPMHYQKLQLSLEQKLRCSNFNHEKQRDELVMLEKCKSYFQLRKKKSNEKMCVQSHKNSIHEKIKRPLTSSHQRNSIFIQKLQNVMKDCNVQQKEDQQIKENMNLFGFYCRVMNKRLECFKNKIEKKERMI